MVLASLLSSTKYIIVNKDLIKMLGLHEAVILGELCSEYTYWESTKQLEQNEYFYSTRENIEKNTGINAHFQRIAIKNLEEKGILLCKRMGIPCKKYYKINENAVVEYLRKAKDNLVVHEVNDKNETECNSNNLFSEMQEENNMNINNNNINNNEEHILNSFEERINYKNIKKTKFNTYNQREYSSGFFDSLYANKQII